MDETVAEELEFHQQTVATDANSPLHLIREKELEISGRMLAAKRKADEIVAEARTKAAALVASAQDDAKEQSHATEKLVKAELDQQVVQVGSDTDAAVADLERIVEQKRDKAVTFVVEAVLGR